MDRCTHKFKWNDERDVVNACAAADELGCKADDRCIWNECWSDFGNQDTPCGNETLPYCVQANGQFNPGTCSANETEQIKCVPALDADFQNRDQLLACLVSNTEDTCALDEACRWEGEKTICHDTPGWSAFR